MQQCRKCKVSVNGNKRCCPLCQGELLGASSENAYPHFHIPKYSKNLLMKLISFIAISLIIISLAVNLMVPTNMWWSLFAIGGVISAWITATVAIRYRRKLFKNITRQLFIVTIFAVIWDLSTGWLGWSIDYVLPISCMASMLSMYLLSKIMKIPVNEYILYLILDGVYGIVPVIFIFTGVLKIIYPSVICVACSLISIVALLIFEGKNMREEISKKMHL